MKKLFFIALAACMANGAFAQNNNTAPACPKFFMGLSAGTNNQSGAFGLNLELPVNDRVTLGSGVGGSTWGAKAYAEVRYYSQSCFMGWAIGAGFTHSAGIYDMKLSLPDNNGVHHDMNLRSDPMTNAFVAGYKFWKIGKNHNRFYLEAGYSVPFTRASYSVKSGETLSDEADWTVRALAPGGFIGACGFSFAL